MEKEFREYIYVPLVESLSKFAGEPIDHATHQEIKYIIDHIMNRAISCYPEFIHLDTTISIDNRIGNINVGVIPRRGYEWNGLEISLAIMDNE